MSQSTKLRSLAAKIVVGALAATAVAVTGAMPASAHVSVNMHAEKAFAGKGAVLYMRVPHGAADKTTVKVEVKIPEGVTGVKPENIGGWTESTTMTADGKNVATVIWTGGNLPDSSFKDFGIKVTLPNTPGATLYFPTVQTLNDGSQEAWITIPVAGAASPAMPAPSVVLLDPATATADTTVIAKTAADAAAAVATLTGSLTAANDRIAALEKALKASKSGELDATLSTKTKKVRVLGDTASIHKGKKVTLNIIGANGKSGAAIYTGKLDAHGDIDFSVAMEKKNSYRLVTGDVVQIMSGSTVLAATVIK